VPPSGVPSVLAGHGANVADLRLSRDARVESDRRVLCWKRLMSRRSAELRPFALAAEAPLRRHAKSLLRGRLDLLTRTIPDVARNSNRKIAPGYTARCNSEIARARFQCLVTPVSGCNQNPVFTGNATLDDDALLRYYADTPLVAWRGRDRRCWPFPSICGRPDTTLCVAIRPQPHDRWELI